jgi:hypothetical protein
MQSCQFLHIAQENTHQSIDIDEAVPAFPPAHVFVIPFAALVVLAHKTLPVAHEDHHAAPLWCVKP